MTVTNTGLPSIHRGNRAEATAPIANTPDNGVIWCVRAPPRRGDRLPARERPRPPARPPQTQPDRRLGSADSVPLGLPCSLRKGDLLSVPVPLRSRTVEVAPCCCSGGRVRLAVSGA